VGPANVEDGEAIRLPTICNRVVFQ